MPGILAVIPARGGSKGLPRKNILPLAGIPLIGHSVQLAKMCPEITRIVVSTDSTEIADTAQNIGAEVPFLRPQELAQDDTPILPVLRHALETLDPNENQYDYLLSLEPTSPGRMPSDITQALAKLQDQPKADGIIGVHQPEYNVFWHSVIEKDGWLTDLFEEGAKFTRRQDIPTVYRLNACLFLWRSEFIRRPGQTNWRVGKHLILEVPEKNFVHIDEQYELDKADLLIRHGFIHFPWLTEK
jgi:N-acylneuraminate cytidylyltransferase